MANITVSTTSNLDSTANLALNHGETVTINNGAILTINSDNRYSQQAAVIGNLTIDSATGGKVLVDGTSVWWIPFDAGSGTTPPLPPLGTYTLSGSSGGLGELLGIYSALATRPLTASEAVPATGFVKLRNVASPFVDNEVITLSGGVSLTVNSPTGGRRGWLNVTGMEATTITVPRLGEFKVTGDWFDLGTTLGLSSQTFQYYVADACPAIQIETSVGSNTYEWWINAGSRWNVAGKFVPNDIRGKFFGMSNTTGLITIAASGANGCGYLPASGLRVRCPNVHFSNTFAPSSFQANTINATLATRWDFTTTSSGVIDIDKAAANIYYSFAQPYSVKLTNSSTLHAINISECATPIYIDSFAIGCNSTTDPTHPITLTSNLAGTNIVNSRVVRYSSANNNGYGALITSCENVTISSTNIELFGSTAAGIRGAAAVGPMSLVRTNNSRIIGNNFINGETLLTECQNVILSGNTYADSISGNTATSNPVYLYRVIAGCDNIRMYNYFPYGGLANLQPYNGLVSLTDSYNCVVRDMGTPTSPINLGTISPTGVIVNSGGNNSGHKLQRLYAQNLRTGAFTQTNSDSNFVVSNVWGDFADSQAFTTLNTTHKGGRWTGSLAGQTAVYGTHWTDAFTGSTTGRIQIHCNEPTSSTSTQCSATSGTPKFTSTGQVSMPSYGDQITWTIPYYCIGHTGFSTLPVVVRGVGTGVNLTHEYQIDKNDGSGFGSWKTLNALNLSAESSIDHTLGFKLKVRSTTIAASAVNAISYISLSTLTDASSQQVQYPLEEPTLTYTGLVSGSSMASFRDSDDYLVDYQTSTGTSITLTNPWSSNYSVVVRHRKAGYQPDENTLTITDTSQTIPVVQTDWTSISGGDLGVLGISVINHGANPVSWNGKDFSITIQTSNDNLTAEQIAEYIHWNIAKNDTFFGFRGMAWPKMIVPNGSQFETARGRLFGSAGAASKGVRVVRSDGTTAVPDFVQFQADDGTYYVVPIGFNFSGLVTGSQVVVFNTGTQTEVFRTNSSGTSETANGLAAGSYDYTVMKTGYLPIRVTGVDIDTTSVDVAIQQTVDRAYATSSGLTHGTTASLSGTTFTVTVPTTVQNWYSFWIESWISQSEHANALFPIEPFGANSFTLTHDHEFSSGSIQYLKRDGFRYLNSSDVVTAKYCAVLSQGVMGGSQVEYYHDNMTVIDALSTGNIDQVVQFYGDASHGNIDHTNYFDLKVQTNGYRQAETSIVDVYGPLEETFYVVALPEVEISNLTLGDPAISGVSITDDSDAPISWDAGDGAKNYSITITDTGSNSGEEILRWLNYNLSLDASFQGKDPFFWPEMVLRVGTTYETVRGNLHKVGGDTICGVRVIDLSGTPHPDFTRFQSDDGTYGTPPVLNDVLISNITAGSRLRIYNETTATEVYNDIVPGTSYSTTYTEGSDYTTGDVVNVRLAYQSGLSAKLCYETNTVAGAAGWSVLASQEDDTVYATYGTDGSTISSFSADIVNNEVDVIIGSDFYGADLYSWCAYILTTADGIRNFCGAVEAIDAANIINHVDVASLYLDNTTATNIKQLDNIRLYRSDGAYPVHSSGGGGIDVVWRDKVFVVETGTSGLTPSESAAITAIQNNQTIINNGIKKASKLIPHNTDLT
jgi:hypothetical protein